MHHQLDSLNKVKHEFTKWRQQRPRKTKTPAFLWDMVKSLLDEYPTYIISRELGISSAQIKKYVLESNVTFVEALSLDTTEACAKSPSIDENTPQIEKAKHLEPCCDIELKRPCGSVLKINALPITVLSTLIPSFVGV